MRVRPWRSGDQPFILVKAQRARGHAEFFRQVGDAVALPFAVIGQFDAGDAAALVHGYDVIPLYVYVKVMQRRPPVAASMVLLPQ